MTSDITPNELAKVYGVGIRWTDPDGITHAVEGSETPADGRLLWPRCGNGDVPAGEASFGNAGVTCPSCVALMAGEAKKPVAVGAAFLASVKHDALVSPQSRD
ncbi:hypothetical protein [Mesorhizobium sp. CN2-181]|uniref:hypothetical protein n=1 Tax=Mesorhizobium yinganensis TaxID=3157707 RepID=UPI0032B715AB